jgi:hypothetical protein
MNRKSEYLTKTYFFTKYTSRVQLNTIIRKSQTLSDQVTESHSSMAVCSSLSELASLGGFVEGWTAEK